MSTLAEMNVSLVHRVVPAEENPLDNRSCTLESYTPKLLQAIETSETAVTQAPIDVPLPKTIGAGKNANEGLNAVTALFSNDRAKFRMLPSDGG